jgi:hypothetical protein
MMTGLLEAAFLQFAVLGHEPSPGGNNAVRRRVRRQPTVLLLLIAEVKRVGCSGGPGPARGAGRAAAKDNRLRPERLQTKVLPGAWCGLCARFRAIFWPPIKNSFTSKSPPKRRGVGGFDG